MFDAELLPLFLKLFIALIALSNPFWGIPVFLSLTSGFTPQRRRRTALITSAAVAVTALITLLAGKDLLAFFGIHVPSFRIAGGIVILLMALAMLNPEGGKKTGSDDASDGDAAKRNIAVVPLAVPYLAGPAVITTIIVFAHSLHDMSDYLAGVAAIFLVALIEYIGLYFAQPIANFMGDTGIDIVSRIMAVLLAAIAVEMVLAGVDLHYPNIHQPPVSVMPAAQ